MSRLRPIPRYSKLLGVILICWCSAVMTFAQSTTDKQEPIAKSIVKGRVIYDDTDRPVRRAVVRLVQGSQDRGGDHSSATARDGSFVIRDVPAGRFVVWVDAPGLITPIAFMKLTEKGPDSWNEKEIKSNFTEVETDGSNTVEVKVRAKRGGAISGSIKYQDGDPVTNAQISIVKRTGKEMVRVISGISPSTLFSLATDDRGRYRIFGLPPGEYLVAVVETHTAPDNTKRVNRGDDFFTSDSLSTYFYGATGKLQDAATVKVEAGSDLTDIDITIPDLLAHTIGGTITAHIDGRPLPGATITVVNRDQTGWFLQGSQQTSTDERGQWSLDGVPDGTYTLTIQPPSDVPVGEPEAEPPADPDEANPQQRKEKPKRHFVSKQTEVTVMGQDVLGVATELAEGASISGPVELPQSAEDVYVMVSCAYENGKPRDYRNTGNGYNGKEFKIEGLEAGSVHLNVSVYNRGETAKQYYVKSITLNGRDLMKQPLSIKEGESIQNVRIVIASDVAKADVLLLDNEGRPIVRKDAVIVPVDSSRWYSADALFTGTSDAKGALHFVGAPGEYLVIVSNDENSPTSFIEYLRAHAETAPHITIQPGENKSITVTLPH